MNPQDPLAALHPLREPDAISWWPPAPGWWFLALLCGIALVACAVMLARRYRRNAYRRRALAQLRELQARFNADGDAIRYASDTNALLKSVALHAYPRYDVAAVHSERWVEFLNRDSGPDARFEVGFTHAIYQPAAQAPDARQLHLAAKYWIAHHRSAP